MLCASSETVYLNSCNIPESQNQINKYNTMEIQNVKDTEKSRGYKYKIVEKMRQKNRRENMINILEVETVQ
jgi:hypothetical protein